MNPAHLAFLQALGAVARDLDRALVEGLACRLDALPAMTTWPERQAVAGGFAPTFARSAVVALLAAWERGAPDLSPMGVACALRAADGVDAWHRARSASELVWTGPVPPGTCLRRTDQALLDVIAAARLDLLIVSFAVYGAERLHDALVDAIGRGVRVRLVLESPEQSRRRLDSTSQSWLTGPLAATAERYVWPYGAREKVVNPFGQLTFGLLHAKCAVADAEVLFISSANLTDHAMVLNMELGVLVRGGPLPGDVRRHFDGLIGAGVLARPDH